MGPRDANQEAALVRGRPPLPTNAVRGRPARQARALAGGGHPRGDRVSLARGRHDRPGPGSCPRTTDQACDQAGGPVIVQSRDRCRRLAGPLGAICGGGPIQHHGCDGLDRLRRRRPGDNHAVAAEPPRPGDTATLKDRRNDYEYRVLVRLAEVLPADVGGQHLGQAHQNPIFIVVASILQRGRVARPWRLSSDSMIVAWPSASKSVQSIATVMLDRPPTTYGTQWTSKASTSI